MGSKSKVESGRSKEVGGWWRQALSLQPPVMIHEAMYSVKKIEGHNLPGEGRFFWFKWVGKEWVVDWGVL